MEKEFIPHEQALELKELGFDKPCFVYYKASNNNHLAYANHGITTNNQLSKGYLDNVAAPLYQQAFRWFDENTDFQGFVIDSIKECHFDWKIINLNTEERIECEEYYSTRQEAELECLKKLIEITKNK